jgi:hypothetical protein
MSYSELKNDFVSKTMVWFMSSHSFVDVMYEEIKGVSFVPIHRYGVGRAELEDKVCVVLGKERAGIYKDKYNFFGGKMEKTWNHGCPWETVSTKEKVECVLGTLFDETAEEFGIMLDFEKFTKSCVSITRHGVSVVFWCHIVGVNRSAWTGIMSDPKRSTAWKYQEMDAIEHVPVSSILDRLDLSSYVRELAGKATMVCKTLEYRPACSFGSLTTTSGLL